MQDEILDRLQGDGKWRTINDIADDFQRPKRTVGIALFTLFKKGLLEKKFEKVDGHWHVFYRAKKFKLMETK